MANNTTVKIGLWGGPGGQPRDIIAHPPRKLVSVKVRSEAAIHAIDFTYIDINGNQHVEQWGGLGGNPQDPFILQDGEYVKEILGTYGPWIHVPAVTVVTSLKFVTNLGRTAEYGAAGAGGSFHVPLINAQISGFCGSVGDLIDAIGIYVVLP